MAQPTPPPPQPLPQTQNRMNRYEPLPPVVPFTLTPIKPKSTQLPLTTIPKRTLAEIFASANLEPITPLTTTTTTDNSDSDISQPITNGLHTHTHSHTNSPIHSRSASRRSSIDSLEEVTNTASPSHTAAADAPTSIPSIPVDRKDSVFFVSDPTNQFQRTFQPDAAAWNLSDISSDEEEEEETRRDAAGHTHTHSHTHDDMDEIDRRTLNIAATALQAQPTNYQRPQLLHSTVPSNTATTSHYHSPLSQSHPTTAAYTLPSASSTSLLSPTSPRTANSILSPSLLNTSLLTNQRQVSSTLTEIMRHLSHTQEKKKQEQQIVQQQQQLQQLQQQIQQQQQQLQQVQSPIPIIPKSPPPAVSIDTTEPASGYSSIPIETSSPSEVVDLAQKRKEDKVAVKRRRESILQSALQAANEARADEDLKAHAEREQREQQEREQAPSMNLDDGLDDESIPVDMTHWKYYSDSSTGRDYWHHHQAKRTIWRHPHQQREVDREVRRERERQEAAVIAEAERLEKERKAAARALASREAAIRAEAERMEAARLEEERLEAEQRETERVEAIRLEAARQEGIRLAREAALAKQQEAAEEAAARKRKDSLSRFNAAQTALSQQFGATKRSPPPSTPTSYSSLAGVDLNEVIDMRLWQSFEDAKGRTYWYHMETGETIWLHPLKRQEKARKKQEMEAALAESKRLAEIEEQQAQLKKKLQVESEAKRMERERAEKQRFDQEQSERELQRRSSTNTSGVSIDASSSSSSQPIETAPGVHRRESSQRFLAAQQALSSQFGASIIASPTTPIDKFTQPPLESRSQHQRRASKNLESWTAYTDPQTGRTYWFNSITNESSWTDPNSIAPQDDSAWTTHQSETGKTYWFNSETGETTWLNPHLVGEERAREETRLLAEAAEEERAEREEQEALLRQQREIEAAEARRVADAAAAAEAARIEAEQQRRRAELAAAEARRNAEAEAAAAAAAEAARLQAEADALAAAEAAEAEALAQAEAEEARLIEEAAEAEEQRRKVEEAEKAAAAATAAATNPSDWTEYTDSQSGRKYWYNAKTTVSSWTDPNATSNTATTTPTKSTPKVDVTAAAATTDVLSPPTSPSGPSFTEDEIEAAWKSYVDKNSKQQYWYNSLTKISAWKDPRKDRTKLNPGNIHVVRRASSWARTQKQNLHAVIEEEEEVVQGDEVETTTQPTTTTTTPMTMVTSVEEFEPMTRKPTLSIIGEADQDEEGDEDDSTHRRPSKTRSASRQPGDDSSSSEDEDEDEEMYQARAAMVAEESIRVRDIPSASAYTTTGGNFILYQPIPNQPLQDCQEQPIQVWVEFPGGLKLDQPSLIESVKSACIYLRPVSGSLVASPTISKDKTDPKTQTIRIADLLAVNTGLPEDFALAEKSPLTQLPMTSQQCLTIRTRTQKYYLRCYRLTRDRKQAEADQLTHGYDKRTLDESERQRENWLLALLELMKYIPHDKPVVATLTAAPTIPTKKPLTNLGLFDVAIRLMRRGALFTRFLPDRSYQSIYMWLHVPGVPELQANVGPNARQSVLGGGSTAQIIHFNDLQYASLQWVAASESVSKTVDPKRGLPLSLIQEIVPGKNRTTSEILAAIWSNPTFSTVDDSSCLNYLAPAAGDGSALPNVLALQCSSKKVRDAWLNAWGAYWQQEFEHRSQTFTDGSSIRPRANAINLEWHETSYGAGKPQPAYATKKANTTTALEVTVPSSPSPSSSSTPESGEVPEQWIEYFDQNKKRPYYYNIQTKKVVWRDPRKDKRHSIILSPITKRPIPALPTSPTSPTNSIANGNGNGHSLNTPVRKTSAPPPIPPKKKTSDGSSASSVAAAEAATRAHAQETGLY